MLNICCARPSSADKIGTKYLKPWKECSNVKINAYSLNKHANLSWNQVYSQKCLPYKHLSIIDNFQSQSELLSLPEVPQIPKSQCVKAIPKKFGAPHRFSWRFGEGSFSMNTEMNICSKLH